MGAKGANGNNKLNKQKSVEKAKSKLMKNFSLSNQIPGGKDGQNAENSKSSKKRGRKNSVNEDEDWENEMMERAIRNEANDNNDDGLKEEGDGSGSGEDGDDGGSDTDNDDDQEYPDEVIVDLVVEEDDNNDGPDNDSYDGSGDVDEFDEELIDAENEFGDGNGNGAGEDNDLIECNLAAGNEDDDEDAIIAMEMVLDEERNQMNAYNENDDFEAYLGEQGGSLIDIPDAGMGVGLDNVDYLTGRVGGMNLNAGSGAPGTLGRPGGLESRRESVFTSRFLMNRNPSIGGNTNHYVNYANTNINEVNYGNPSESLYMNSEAFGYYDQNFPDQNQNLPFRISTFNGDDFGSEYDDFEEDFDEQIHHHHHVEDQESLVSVEDEYEIYYSSLNLSIK